MQRMKCIGKTMVTLSLVWVLSGCGGALSTNVSNRVTDEELLPAVARVIDEQKDVIVDYIGEDGARALGEIDGQSVVESALTEENGREYLEFCYQVNDSEDVDAVMEAARPLLSSEQMVELEEKVETSKCLMMEKGEEVAKALAPSLRPAFWKDMQELVVKSTVLFAAGIVYACIPHAVWWGKIAAAAAVAVASGVVAATVMSLIRFYKFGGDKGESFQEWLTSVTTEPKASYALAASMISLGTTLKRSPVLTGIIICVFGLYSIVDDVKPLLAKYKFNV